MASKAARSYYGGLEVLLYSYVTTVEMVAVHRYYGGLEVLLYSYVKANETDKR